MAAIRAFIALTLPQRVVDYLTEIAVRLDQDVPDRSVRWVKPEAMHLTLRFLGDTQPQQIPALGSALLEIAQRIPALELSLTRIGYFPNASRPSVVWAGLKERDERLGTLAAEIEAAVVALGWPREKGRFHPHLTLGRIKDSRKLPRDALPRQLQLEPISWRATSFHLVRSELRPSGPIYSNLRSFTLGSR